MNGTDPVQPNETDLEDADAAEAPAIAESLADRLEADLAAVTDPPGGDD